MADVNQSPNMGLPIPIPGTTPGPAWANDVSACLLVLDSHDHTTGSGVPITPSAININADLDFKGFNATNINGVVFKSLASSPGSAGTICEVGVDLYYVDGNGNPIRITQDGSVSGSSGTITGLPSGTASASYSSSSQTFIFQSATNVAANLDVRSIILRNSSANSKGLTLSPPALAADYTITLPTLPASQSIVTIDQTGAMSAPGVYPLQTPSYANASVTAEKVATTAIGTSVISAFSTSSSTPVQVTGLGTATITVYNNPVFVGLTGGATPTSASVVGVDASGSVTNGQILIYRDGSAVATFPISQTVTITGSAAVTTLETVLPSSSIWFIDQVTPGSHTYTVWAKLVTGNFIFVTNAVLIAREM